MLWEGFLLGVPVSFGNQSIFLESLLLLNF